VAVVLGTDVLGESKKNPDIDAFDFVFTTSGDRHQLCQLAVFMNHTDPQSPQSRVG